MSKKNSPVQKKMDLINFEPCMLLSYEKREKLKDSGDPDDYAYVRWLRFVETDVFAGYKVISLTEYKKWLREYPGWSCGFISKWRREKNEYGSSLPMNQYLRRKKQ